MLYSCTHMATEGVKGLNLYFAVYMATVGVEGLKNQLA